MSEIKHNLLALLAVVACYQLVQCRILRRVSDYDAQSVYSDYFDTTASESANGEEEETTTISGSSSSNTVTETETTTQQLGTENDSAETDDDGVTCSSSNVTQVLSAFDVENFVLVLFRVNVTNNDEELVLFLNLARRFTEASALFFEHRFVVVTMDGSSEMVKEFITADRYPNDIIVIDDEEFPDLGFVIDFDELNVYVVDQCGRLAYIIMPPWSSAKHPFVKAAVLSTILDLPCDCPADFMSEDVQTTMRRFSTTESPSISVGTASFRSSNDYGGEEEEEEEEDEDVENIEHLLDNANSINDSFAASENASLPLRIIISSSHVHFDNVSKNYYKYEEIVFKSGDDAYHQHIDAADVLLDVADERLQNFTSSDMLVGNKSLADIRELASRKRVLVNRLGYIFEVLREQHGNALEVEPLDFDVVKVAPSTQLFGVKHHYKQLNKWLLYKI